jgi:tRNA-dihydrouridine synthase B
MRLVAGAVRAGQQNRQQGHPQRRQTLAAQRAAEEQAKDGVFDEVQRLVPHEVGDGRHRVGLRRDLENDRHVESWRQPEPRTTHSTIMRIGRVELPSPLAVAPMAGMTDTAFRRLVKRHGGCGLVVTEMVSAEGLVRGIDRTLEYAEYTEEERPISIQIFGGDPEKMAAAARIVEELGADIVDVNMGCPVPKIAKHNAGCSLMREPQHAAAVVAAMARAVKIPVTVKMRAGWNDSERNAPALAKRVEDAGAAAVTIHGRTAAQSYSGQADWDLVASVADDLTIPVLGSGDCVEPGQVVARLSSGVDGVLVGRGVLRNPWILAQAVDLAAGRTPRDITLEDRGRFLLEYIDLLTRERVREPEGFRHAPAGLQQRAGPPASHDRWVINKVRALGSWYTKGIEHGGHLRTAINGAESLDGLRELIQDFFLPSCAELHAIS